MASSQQRRQPLQPARHRTPSSSIIEGLRVWLWGLQRCYECQRYSLRCSQAMDESLVIPHKHWTPECWETQISPGRLSGDCGNRCSINRAEFGVVRWGDFWWKSESAPVQIFRILEFSPLTVGFSVSESNLILACLVVPVRTSNYWYLPKISQTFLFQSMRGADGDWVAGGGYPNIFTNLVVQWDTDPVSGGICRLFSHVLILTQLLRVVPTGDWSPDFVRSIKLWRRQPWCSALGSVTVRRRCNARA